MPRAEVIIAAVAALACVPALAASGPAPWVLDPNETILPSSTPPDDARSRIELVAGQGDVEGQVVALRPATQVNVTPRPGVLVGPATIDASRVRVSVIDYVPVTRTSTGVDRLASDRYPDPLTDLAAGDSATLAAGETRGLLVEVDVPAGQDPGRYEGQVDIQPFGPVGISLDVLPVQVDRDRRPFIGRLDVTTIARLYGVSESDPRLQDGLHAHSLPMLRAHGISPSQIPGSTPEIDPGTWAGDWAGDPGSRLAAGAARGFPMLEMPYLPHYASITDREYTDPRRGTWAATLSAAYRGLGRSLFSLPVDEPNEGEYPVVARAADQLRAAGAPVRIMVTEAPTDQAKAVMGGAVDIWAPTLWNYYLHRTRMDQLRAEGKGTWWYVYGSDTQRYTPNVLIDKSLAEPRVMGWLAEEMDVQGTFYWALTAWREGGGARDPLVQPWGLSHVTKPDQCSGGGREVGGNGEGSLLYPSGDMSQPLRRSLRLVAVRDGLEDASLIAALKARDPAAAARLATATASPYSGQNTGFTPCGELNRPPYLPVVTTDPGEFAALRLWMVDRVLGRPGATLIGRVTHRGQPVRGATVRVAGLRAVTDASGRYRLPGITAARTELVVSRDREGRVDRRSRVLTRSALRAAAGKSLTLPPVALRARTERPLFDSAADLRGWRARALPAKVRVVRDYIVATVSRRYQPNGREINNGNIIAPEIIRDFVGVEKPRANWSGWRALRMTVDLRDAGPQDQPWRLVVTPGGHYLNARYLVLAPGIQQVELPLRGLRNLRGTRYL
ncbi:MAG: carboxypeptidase regulatory-like domain-containing protein, partial [Actinobacteria bacterium]|nr:carboxypeptidase regulatory-like domain-containing protein [Actinomycetota bacterium]